MFRNNIPDWRLNSKAFDRYMRMLQVMLSKSPNAPDAETLDYLRTLDVLLQDHCLLELEPFNENGRSFGIGPKTTDTGDILIPLWRLGWHAGGSRRMVTMLVVRPIKDHYTSIISEMKESIPQGRVIGPAVCVISESQSRNEHGQRFSAEQHPSSCSMYLV